MAKHSKGAERGPGGFERFYSDLFGERWPALRAALLRDPAHVALETGLLKPYFLDAASLMVALALDVRPGNDVLDLCAAPGGKTLVAALCLGGDGRLVANERSASRRARLHRVLATHLSPRDRTLVQITGHDATRWGLYEPARYDRVLADVPCSSERHVIRSNPALAQWSPSRTQRLAGGAYAIACAAADSLKPGGLLLYSTCALSARENDGVIERLLRRDKGSGPLRPVSFPGARRAVPLREGIALPERDDAKHLALEPTAHGNNLLPDRNNGAGPMYFALLTK